MFSTILPVALESIKLLGGSKISIELKGTFYLRICENKINFYLFKK